MKKRASESLRRWLAENHWSQTEFSELMDVTPETFSRWLSGATTPGIHRAVAIELLTSGDVPVTGWCQKPGTVEVEDDERKVLIRKWRTARAEKKHQSYLRRF